MPWTDAMRAGRWADAWALETATIARRDPATRDDPALPYHRRWVWDGRAVADRDVLVRCYHGLGDTIQFARYLPVLAARARSVTLEVQPSLIPLLSGMVAGDIVPFDVARPLPPGDCDIEITELPCALGVAPDAVAIPYIASPPAAVAGGTIGLCHRAGDWDAERSFAVDLLRPIAERHACAMLATGATTLPVTNPAGCPADMGETAALVAAVDLVITVDTMIAHLAGAMGRPTWLLLKAEPDWRWSPDRRDTPWYPTMRLYHQPRPGDWATVLATIAAELSPVHPHRSPAPWPA